MHLHEDDLILHFYGEMDRATEARTEAHLAECAECHAGYARLQRVMAAVDAVPPAEPADGFERIVWARLEPTIRWRTREAPRRWFLFSPAHLAWAATVVALVGASFFAGRVFQRGGGVSSPDEVRERILLAEIGNHLDRSQNVLVELASAPADASVDISAERARAEQIVEASRIYRQTAVQSGDVAIADLLDEIERVLVDVAAGPAQVPAAELSGVQRRIDARDLLFKIRVLANEVRERQREMNQRPSGRTL
jgi:hypothetical protein